jgi:flavin-dependent dehydrogenase
MIHDVAVAGAGLAGLQAARILASRGLRVVLLDRKTSVAETVHTTGIFVRKTWEDFALPAEQLGRGIRKVTLYSPARRTIKLEAPQDEFRVGRMSWIYLYLLEQCSRAGVEWIPGARLSGWDAATIEIERNGRKERLLARYLIGADGARSAVARHLGLDRNRDFLVGLEDVLPSRANEPALHCYLDPRLAPGYIAWVVDDGEEAHVGVAGRAGRFNPAAALERFRRSIGASDAAIERRGGLIPVNGILERIANKSGLLLGDAAGAVSPLTAGGLDGALRLSAFAADVVSAFLDTGDASILRQYDGRRFQARFVARRWMRRLMRAVEHPLAMEVALAVFRHTPLRRMAEHVFFARGSFPDVSLIQAARRTSVPLRP